MRIKIIETHYSGLFEQELNKFNEAHNVRFTQTHVAIRPDNTLWYTGIIFYEEFGNLHENAGK